MVAVFWIKSPAVTGGCKPWRDLFSQSSTEWMVTKSLYASVSFGRISGFFASWWMIFCPIGIKSFTRLHIVSNVESTSSSWVASHAPSAWNARKSVTLEIISRLRVIQIVDTYKGYPSVGEWQKHWVFEHLVECLRFPGKIVLCRWAQVENDQPTMILQQQCWSVDP